MNKAELIQAVDDFVFDFVFTLFLNFCLLC